MGCPDGMNIPDITTCMAAAVDLGPPTSNGSPYNTVLDNLSNPKGCFLNTASNRIYFNGHSTGNSGSSQMEPICVGSSSGASSGAAYTHQDGDTTCPDWMNIPDITTCMAAAVDLGPPTSDGSPYNTVLDNLSNPKGCFLNTASNRIYFNGHSTGNSGSS